ncbi:hypothetical protein F5Y10DRAFT_57979 [Nemania abortiva]|nr:hypothetical protein F5Y10DRAFT_57979 [Nemania abortiva]
MVDSPAAAANAHYHNPYDLHHHPHHHLAQQASLQQNAYYGYASPTPTATPSMRKRKAESQDNERLSKRLSLLNLGRSRSPNWLSPVTPSLPLLWSEVWQMTTNHDTPRIEKNGHKLYVPVESPSLQSISEHPGYNNSVPSSSSSASTAGDSMQLDDTKHKVYIYDLDAELSSADEYSESESSLPGSPTSGRSRIILSPDIKKHIRRSRIPPAVLANSNGELAGHNINDMQMVLYSEPSSLTIPREQDSVRKAIMEARARARQKQKDSQAEIEQPNTTIPTASSPVASLPDFGYTNSVDAATNGFGSHLAQNSTAWNSTLAMDDDVDAMDMD